MKAWLEAIRPRTLPLALSSIGMGSFLAASIENFSWQIFLFCALTTLFLQILSNLANDYGDSIHGADSIHREGPLRAVQAGYISISSMKAAMIIVAALSLLSGTWLLYISLGFNIKAFLFFFVLGLLSIMAAVSYTAGRKPYGYAGLGDLSVMIFFGIVGVLGTFYLHTESIEWIYILPALSCGFFSTAVLNVNNIRDIESDRLAGKKSIPVRIGRKKAVVYHGFLLSVGIISSLFFVVINFKAYWQWLFLISIPLFIHNGIAVAHKKKAVELDPYLKQMALATLIYVLSFGIGLMLS